MNSQKNMKTKKKLDNENNNFTIDDDISLEDVATEFLEKERDILKETENDEINDDSTELKRNIENSNIQEDKEFINNSEDKKPDLKYLDDIYSNDSVNISAADLKDSGSDLVYKESEDATQNLVQNDNNQREDDVSEAENNLVLENIDTYKTSTLSESKIAAKPEENKKDIENREYKTITLKPYKSEDFF